MASGGQHQRLGGERQHRQWLARVFICYAHESAESKAAALRLARLLQAHGFHVVMDQIPGPPERRNNDRWKTEQIAFANFVLVIVSQALKNVCDERMPAGYHRGLRAEAEHLRNRMNDDRDTWTRKIIPILLPGVGPELIPDFLSGSTDTYYRVTELSDSGARELLELLHHYPPPEPERLPDEVANGRAAGFTLGLEGQGSIAHYSRVGTHYLKSKHKVTVTTVVCITAVAIAALAAILMAIAIAKPSGHSAESRAYDETPNAPEEMLADRDQFPGSRGLDSRVQSSGSEMCIYIITDSGAAGRLFAKPDRTAASVPLAQETWVRLRSATWPQDWYPVQTTDAARTDGWLRGEDVGDVRACPEWVSSEN